MKFVELVLWTAAGLVLEAVFGPPPSKVRARAIEQALQDAEGQGAYRVTPSTGFHLPN